MTTLIITLFIAAVIVAVIAEIMLRKQRPSGGPGLELSKEIAPVFEDVKEFGKSLWPQPQHPGLPEAFRAWAAKNLDKENAGLKNWFGSMPTSALEALTRHLAHYCTELNFELAWLVSEEIELDPTLEQGLQEVVVSYCWGCWKAVQIQPDIEVFRTLLAVTHNPTALSHQAVSQKLLSQLRKHDLAPEPDPGWFLASEKQRRDYLSEVIRQASEKDQVKFYSLFHEVVHASSNGATPESVTGTSSPPPASTNTHGA